MGQATDFLCTKAGFLDPGLTERKDLPHLQLSHFEIRICFNHYFIIKNQTDQEAMSVFHPVVFFFFYSWGLFADTGNKADAGTCINDG